MNYSANTNMVVRKAGTNALIVMLLMGMSSIAFGQESISLALKSDIQKADHYYNNASYQNALELYLKLEERNELGRDACLKVANAFYELKNYADAARWYTKYMSASSNRTPGDILKFAESLNATKEYEEAIEWYKTYLEHHPNDRQVMNKIWRLKNIEFLYEDSIYYIVKPISINTEFGEMAPYLYRDQLIFLSNRKGYTPLGKTDAKTNNPFYRAYYSPLLYDSADGEISVNFGKSRLFAKELKPTHHQGPLAFYDYGKKMLYISDEASGTKNTLKLYSAENIMGKWKKTGPFPYNSSAYSIYDITINEEGNIMYLSSDMKGGKGGTDLYVSSYKDGKWTRPENLGDGINTALDETSPFLHQNSLYFSSNGHAGLGGLDIFRAAIDSSDFGEVINLGYPVNTNHDDFGFYLEGDGTKAYFASNRKSGDMDDDIYRLEISLQSYPYTIHGTLKYKIAGADNSSELKILPLASLELTDLTRNLTIQKSTSDSTGHFSFEIPYYSQYKIFVRESDGSETVVSLEIPKYIKPDTQHEIVIVKDSFDVKEKIDNIKD